MAHTQPTRPPVPPATRPGVPVGTPVILNGYDQPRGVVVSEPSTSPYGGGQQEVVNLTTRRLTTAHIRPADQLGICWKQVRGAENCASPAVVARLRAEAVANREADQAKQEAEAAERQRLTEQGEALIPKLLGEAKAVLVAVEDIDQSDGMTDYFAHTTGRKVVLATSTHTRNLFSEMRKAAARLPETAHLAERRKDWEHRETYSGGGGMFLKREGYQHRSGWRVEKWRLDWAQQDVARLLAQGEHRLPDRAS